MTVNSGKLIRLLADIENRRVLKDVHELNFTLYFPVFVRFLMGLCSIVFLAFSILSIIFINEDTGKIVGGCFFGSFFLLSLASMVYYNNWKLKFDSYGLVYTSGLGKTQELRYTEVHSVYETAGNLLLKTEDLSIHIPNYVIGLPVFLSRLEHEHFEIISNHLGGNR